MHLYLIQFYASPLFRMKSRCLVMNVDCHFLPDHPIHLARALGANAHVHTVDMGSVLSLSDEALFALCNIALDPRRDSDFEFFCGIPVRRLREAAAMQKSTNLDGSLLSDSSSDSDSDLDMSFQPYSDSSLTTSRRASSVPSSSSSKRKDSRVLFSVPRRRTLTKKSSIDPYTRLRLRADEQFDDDGTLFLSLSFYYPLPVPTNFSLIQSFVSHR